MKKKKIEGVGIIKEWQKMEKIGGMKDGDKMVMIGGEGKNIGKQVYMSEILEREEGNENFVDMEIEKRNGEFVSYEIRKGKVKE